MAKNCIKIVKILHKYTENGVFSVMLNHAKVKNAHFTGVSGIFLSRYNKHYTELDRLRMSTNNGCIGQV